MSLTFSQRKGETICDLLSRFQQASASQKLFNGSIYLIKVCISDRLAGDNDHIPAICYHHLAESGCFPHETPGAITPHRPTYPFAD